MEGTPEPLHGIEDAEPKGNFGDLVSGLLLELSNQYEWLEHGYEGAQPKLTADAKEKAREAVTNTVKILVGALNIIQPEDPILDQIGNLVPEGEYKTKTGMPVLRYSNESGIYEPILLENGNYELHTLLMSLFAIDTTPYDSAVSGDAELLQSWREAAKSAAGTETERHARLLDARANNFMKFGPLERTDRKLVE